MKLKNTPFQHPYVHTCFFSLLASSFVLCTWLFMDDNFWETFWNWICQCVNVWQMAYVIADSKLGVLRVLAQNYLYCQCWPLDLTVSLTCSENKVINYLTNQKRYFSRFKAKDFTCFLEIPWSLSWSLLWSLSPSWVRMWLFRSEIFFDMLYKWTQNLRKVILRSKAVLKFAFLRFSWICRFQGLVLNPQYVCEYGFSDWPALLPHPVSDEVCNFMLADRTKAMILVIDLL